MKKKSITESMKVHKKWSEEAKKQTLETLPEFLHHLMEDYGHDYGTICHALAAGSVATAWAMNAHSNGGITGFQSGFVTFGFIEGWSGEDKVCLSIRRYEHMLYPQYQHKFEKTISRDIMDLLIKEAKNKLSENGMVAEAVKNHWENIASGIPPFGYKIIEES